MIASLFQYLELVPCEYLSIHRDPHKDSMNLCIAPSDYIRHMGLDHLVDVENGKDFLTRLDAGGTLVIIEGKFGVTWVQAMDSTIEKATLDFKGKIEALEKQKQSTDKHTPANPPTAPDHHPV